MHSFFVALLLLVPLADPSIGGPDQVKQGQTVEYSLEIPQAEFVKDRLFLIPPNRAVYNRVFLDTESGKPVFVFQSFNKGDYILAYEYDTGQEHRLAVKEFKVIEGIPDPNPNPDPNPDPDPNPNPDPTPDPVDPIAKKVKELAESKVQGVTRAVEAKALATSYKVLVQKINSKEIVDRDQMPDEVAKANRTALANRVDAWGDFFVDYSSLLDNEEDQGKLQTIAEIADFLTKTVNGLETVR